MFRLLLREKNLIKFVNVNRFLSEVAKSSNQGGTEIKEIVKQKKEDKEKERKKAQYEQEKKAHQTFYKDEDRKTSLIEYFDDFFDKNVLKKDTKTFIRAIESFKENNKNR